MKSENVLNVVSVSGGKDSTALYCLGIEFYGQSFLPVFADTGNEHPVTVNYVRNLHLMAGGPVVRIVQADFTEKLRGKVVTGNSFLDMMRWKGRAPSTKAQFCTEWVKLWPILQFLEINHPYQEWIMHVGLRAGESEARAKRYPFEWNKYFDCDSINPLLYETAESIFSYLAEKNVPPNPLYALGYKRVGCFPCIHANKLELSLLPDWAWEKLAYWERELGRSWFPPGVLPGKPPGYVASILEVRQWCKTSRGGKQYDLFKSVHPADAPSCLSTWGICE